MTELKPCPFCCGKAKRKWGRYNLLGAYGTAETYREWFAVFCESCKVGQPSRHYTSRQEAIEAWNRRTENGK